jgi:peptidoglycan hydrolase-like protein with peptidoglycan-binding domain
LRRGSRGAAVRDIQRAVAAELDGKFGPGTEAKVRAFQRLQGLVPDGIVGPATWAKIDVVQPPSGVK